MNPLWTALAEKAGHSLTELQDAQFNQYLDYLSAANLKMNLTRITDRPAAEVQHIGDALTLLPYLPKGPHLLADVGSGGGVPGIPLAIARPDVKITLIESTGKKAAFLKECAAAIGLTNITVVNSRAEDAGLGVLRERFDVATARAVATLDWLAEWCLPLVKKGGKMLVMKGQRAAEELPAAAKAIKLLGGANTTTHAVELPGSEHRVIVEITKVLKTDTRFPRPATSAKGKPLA